MIKATRNRSVWTWEELDSWEGHFWSLMKDVLAPNVVRAFAASPPEYVVGDNLSWLDAIVYDVSGEHVETKAVLAERLRKQFDALRAYHGTRTNCLENFYGRGLVPLHASEFAQRAYELFLTPEFPELTQKHLDDAIAYVGTATREGHLYFCIDKRELTDHCSHYMLYGSEYLLAIASNINGLRNYRHVLKRDGIPTVFVCDVPLASLREGTLQAFSGQALKVMFERVLDANYAHPQQHLGSGISTTVPLPADHIVDHFHPTGLRDQYRNG